jgi:hypothetical protein
MDIFKRLIREFWVPALAAIAWTTYSLATRTSAWDLTAVINIFGPSFFLMSWATGQFFRIKKQTHVDANLKGIEGRLEGLVNKIEDRTIDLLSHITGGESFCYLQLGMLNSTTNEGRLVAVHQGRHPLYEVHARIVDLEYFDKLLKSGAPLAMESCNTNVSIGSLIPGHAAFLQPIRLGSENLLRANVFFTARNGDVTQLIRMIKSNGQWFSATRVKREDRLLFGQIQEGFPGDLSADKDWVTAAQPGAQADGPASGGPAA